MNPARDLLLASLLSVLALPAFGQEPTLVIENGRVIVGDGTVLERASVVVGGERIVMVTEEPVEALAVRRIDASGKTVLPGLIDAHVHLTVSPDVANAAVLERFIADTLPGILHEFLRHGITTVRSTGEHWPWIRDVRDRIASGEMVGPRILTSGPIVTYKGGHPATVLCENSSFCRSTLAVEVGTADEAREAVRRLAAEGVDFIKLAQDTVLAPVQMPDEVFSAIVRQAHRERIQAVAHIESDIADVPAMERAIALGVDGLVHWPLDTIPIAGARQLGRTLVRQGAHVTSTLSSIMIYWWDMPADRPLDPNSQVGKHLLALVRSLAAMVDEGVQMVVGTDWCPCVPRARGGVPALAAGAMTHTEMLWLGMGGIENGDVLAAATSDAARALGLGPVLGTLEAGKLADLIVVRGSPLEDLSALRNVELVVKGGEVVVPRHAQEAVRDSPEAAVEEALHGYFAAFKAQDREAFEPYVTEDFLLYEGGYPVEKSRFVETWDPSSPIEEDHEFSDLEIDVFGDVASLSYVLKWLREGEVRIRGRETALARNVDGQWKFVRFHSSWFPPIRSMEPATLDDYVGTYERCVENQDPECFRLRVWREVDNLFIGRADGEPWIAGLRRLELFPAGEDRFYLEVTTDNVEMPRDERGEVTGMAIHFSIQNETLRFERLEESPQEQR